MKIQGICKFQGCGVEVGVGSQSQKELYLFPVSESESGVGVERNGNFFSHLRSLCRSRSRKYSETGVEIERRSRIFFSYGVGVGVGVEQIIRSESSYASMQTKTYSNCLLKHLYKKYNYKMKRRYNVNLWYCSTKWLIWTALKNHKKNRLHAFISNIPILTKWLFEKKLWCQ